MAADIIITTDDGVLDLFVGAENEFYITRQIHDLNNFETRDASFSKSLEIPPTTNNINILGIQNNDIITQGIQCSVNMGGLMVAPIALLFWEGADIVNDEEVLLIQILAGNFNCFNAIRSGSIDTINWADLATEWEAFDLRNRSSNTTDLVFPLADWSLRTSTPIEEPNLYDVNHAGFFMFCKEIMSRIVSETGFTLVLEPNLPTDFGILALACPVTKFLSLTELGQVSVSQFVEKTIDQPTTDATDRTIFEDDDSTSIWNAGNNEWTISIDQDFTLEVTGTFQQSVTGIRPDSQIRIVRNTSTLATFFVSGDQPAGTAFFLTATVTALIGDVIFVEQQSFVPQATVTVESGTIFKISTIGADTDRTVQPSQFIPQIDRKTFFTSILNIFNLVMITDEIARTVTLRNFNDIFSATEQDLTSRLDVGGKVEIRPGITSIGQNSNFTWNSDNLLRADFNLTVRFENSILETDKTVIALPYSAADGSFNFITPSTVNLKVRVPMYQSGVEFIDPGTVTFITINPGSDPSNFVLSDDVDFTVGDWFEFLGDKYRIVEKSSDRAGAMQGPLVAGSIGTELEAIHSYAAETQEARLALIHIDGSETEIGLSQGRTVVDQQLISTSQTATWFDRLKWDELVPAYYRDILRALQTPQIIKASFNLSVFYFIQLDHLRPIYIDQLNAFFYLNKIEQFKLKKKTRLELIRISSTQVT